MSWGLRSLGNDPLNSWSLEASATVARRGVCACCEAAVCDAAGNYCSDCALATRRMHYLHQCFTARTVFDRLL